MFDQTFVDGAGKTNKGWTVALSLAGEFAAIGFLILIPLLWTEVLPKTQLSNSLLAPAPPPPPPAPVAEAEPVKPARDTPRIFHRESVQIPRTIPLEVAIIADLVPSAQLGVNPDASNIGGVFSELNGGTPGVIGVPSPPAAPVVSRTEAKPLPARPVPVGGKVQSAKLIRQPKPAYPLIAKSGHIEGTVVLQAIIGKDGTVRDLKVLSAANPLLVQAAKDAVSQWVYQPTLLDNEPVEVITEISVTFSLR